MPLSSCDSRHGVMVRYRGKGIFVCGEAGIGKSSLALELLQHGAILIADDIVDFTLENSQLIAHCPAPLENMLYTRELGLLDVCQLFGNNGCQPSAKVDLCLELRLEQRNNVTLASPFTHKQILGYPLPHICLSPNNPATLKTRIDTLIGLLSTHADSLEKLIDWQQQQMAF